MIVIFDIDDCLMPWAEKVHEACILAGLAKEDTLWTQWSMWQDYGCTKEQWLEVVNSLVKEGGIYHAEPYPGVVESVQKLTKLGHEVHLVTARGFFDHAQQIRDWTVDWIETFQIPGTLWFAQDKGEIAQNIAATHAIDDRIDNCEDMWHVGVQAYLMNQPHNLLEPVDDDYRVNSVPEFVEKILHG